MIGMPYYTGMTKQRQRLLGAIQEAVADGVPATYEEIGKRTGMNRNALKSHAEHLARVKPVELKELVGHPVRLPERRYHVTIQKGERRPAEVEVVAETSMQALLDGLRKAGYEATVRVVLEVTDGADKDRN